jgi:CBS-domain-containing membrane protein
MLRNNPDLSFNNLNKIKICDIKRKKINKPVTINSKIESLISLAVNQNFVPVVDDHGIFIGIIKRSDIINYCYQKFIDEK